jgi:hypothetical protein
MNFQAIRGKRNASTGLSAFYPIITLICFPTECNGLHYFPPFEYNALSFSFKGLSKFSITGARANTSKPLNFKGLFIVQFTPGMYNKILGCLIKLCYYLENQESKSYRTQTFTDKLS